MIHISYKGHVWPQNPRFYRDEMARTAHYQGVDEVSEFLGVSPIIRHISGEGAFWGADAYQNYLDLVTLFQDPKPGLLEHPVWGSCLCYFTQLELTQEPKAGYVSYRFGFTGALSNGDIPR